MKMNLIFVSFRSLFMVFTIIIVDEDMKFKEMAEDISNKNAKKSLPGLKFVKARMQKEFMISFLTDYKETLSTELYRALRKSKVHPESPDGPVNFNFFRANFKVTYSNRWPFYFFQYLQMTPGKNNFIMK